MRTVDATLTAALAAGSGKPYLKAYVGYIGGSVKHSYTTDHVRAYRLTGTTLEIWIDNIENFASDQEQIWLERGVTINGTNYTLTTGRFYIWLEEYLPDRVAHYKGGLFPTEFYSDALTTETYQQVIEAFCTAYGKTASFKDAAEAWLAYHFLPNPTALQFTDANTMLEMLAEKRLIGCADAGAEGVRFFSADVLGSSLGDISVGDEFAISTTTQLARQYYWVDELDTQHQDGTATDPVHNLGYLESTDSPPARNNQTYQVEAYVRPDFRWQDGDLAGSSSTTAPRSLLCSGSSARSTTALAPRCPAGA